MSEPQVINATALNRGSSVFITTHLQGYLLQVSLGGIDGSGVAEVWPKEEGQNVMQNDNTTTCYVSGSVLGPGSLYMPTVNGTIPLQYNNTLLTNNPIVIDANIFA